RRKAQGFLHRPGDQHRISDSGQAVFSSGFNVQDVASSQAYPQGNRGAGELPVNELSRQAAVQADLTMLRTNADADHFSRHGLAGGTKRNDTGGQLQGWQLIDQDALADKPVDRPNKRRDESRLRAIVNFLGLADLLQPALVENANAVGRPQGFL